MKRLVIIFGSVIAALLIAVVVVGVVLLNTIQAEADEAAYQACMARQGFPHDAPPPVITDDDEMDTYIDAIMAAAERCHR